MPIYEFECSCGNKFAELVRHSSSDIAICKDCKRWARRVMSVCNFRCANSTGAIHPEETKEKAIYAQKEVDKTRMALPSVVESKQFNVAPNQPKYSYPTEDETNWTPKD